MTTPPGPQEINGEQPQSGDSVVIGSPLRKVVKRRILRRRSPWTARSKRCAVLAALLLLLSAIALPIYTDFTAANAAEKFIYLSAELVGVVIVAALLLVKVGYGEGLLVGALCVFGTTGYIVANQTISTEARQARVIEAFSADMESRSKQYTYSMLSLPLGTVTNMLYDGEPYKKQELAGFRPKLSDSVKETEVMISFTEDRIEKTRKRLMDIDSGASIQFMRSIRKVFPRVRESYTLKKEYYLKFDGLIEFLTEKSGPFEITRKGPKFRRPEDEEQYRKLTHELDEIAAKMKQTEAPTLSLTNAAGGSR